MFNRLKSRYVSLSALSLTLGLNACGGGGGGVGGNSAQITSFNGNVIDGYVTGATVCLDENNNLICDDEFSAVTQAAIAGETGFKSKDGWYTFTVTRAITPGTQVVADIPAGAVDSELGAIQKPFKMLAPVDKPEVISPLTTLISITMKNAGTTDSKQAEKEVKVSLGLAENASILGKDFIADRDQNLTSTAIVTASVIKDATKAIADSIELDIAGNQATLNAEQKEKAALQQALAVVKQQKSSGALDTAIQEVKALRENGTQLTEASVTAAKANAGINIATIITGNWQDIQSQTKSGDGSVVNVAELNGKIMIMSSDNNMIDKDNDPSNNEKLDNDQNPETKSFLRWANWSSWVEGFSAEWFYLPETIVAGKTYDNSANFKGYIIPSQYEISRRTDPALEKKWYLTVDNSWDQIFVGGATWLDETKLKSKVEGNCFIEVLGEQEVRRYCFVEKDFAGKSLKDISPSICLDENNAPITNCEKEAVLKPEEGQQFKIYDITQTVSENSAKGTYSHWGNGGYTRAQTKEDASLERFLFDIAYSKSTGKLRGSHSRGSGDCSNVNFVADISSLEDTTGNVDFDALSSDTTMDWDTFKTKGVKVTKGNLLWVYARNEDKKCEWPSNETMIDLIKQEKYEKTPFEISEIGGKRVMKLISPKIYREKNPGSNDAYLIFAEHELINDGDKYFTVAGGDFYPSNYKREIFFTGNLNRTTVMSTDLFNLILEKRGMQSYPYDEIKGFYK